MDKIPLNIEDIQNELKEIYRVQDLLSEVITLRKEVPSVYYNLLKEEWKLYVNALREGDICINAANLIVPETKPFNENLSPQKPTDANDVIERLASLKSCMDVSSQNS